MITFVDKIVVINVQIYSWAISEYDKIYIILVNVWVILGIYVYCYTCMLNCLNKDYSKLGYIPVHVQKTL